MIEVNMSNPSVSPQKKKKNLEERIIKIMSKTAPLIEFSIDSKAHYLSLMFLYIF